MNGQSKYVCITANQNTECFRYLSANFDLPVQLFEEFGDPNYFVGQVEVGDTGNIHWQLYIEYGAVHRLSTYKRRYFEGCHLEKREKTALQASDYCQKKDRGDLQLQWEECKFRIGILQSDFTLYWHSNSCP